MACFGKRSSGNHSRPGLANICGMDPNQALAYRAAPAPDSDDLIAALETTSKAPEPDDVFAQFVDEVPATGQAARAEFLSTRGYFVCRQVFVQHLDGSPTRPSTLGALVTDGQLRALLLYLLVLACEHRLAGNRRLPAQTWARMLTTANYPCSTTQFRKAVSVLEERQLVRARWTGTSVELWPGYENGNGEAWEQPTGADADPDLQRYFTLPNEFFDDAVLDRLRLPGVAMLLVALKETSRDSTFSISVERYAAWYGFSERTAERGYRELADAGLTRTHKQMIKDPRSGRGGLRARYHRTLLGPFATQARTDARRRAQDSVHASARAQAAAQTEAGHS